MRARAVVPCLVALVDGVHAGSGGCGFTGNLHLFRLRDGRWPLENTQAVRRLRAKRGLSESDICTKFITPALRRAGWDEMLQIREEVGFTKGRIVRGKLVTRGRAKRADPLLQAEHPAGAD